MESLPILISYWLWKLLRTGMKISILSALCYLAGKGVALQCAVGLRGGLALQRLRWVLSSPALLSVVLREMGNRILESLDVTR